MKPTDKLRRVAEATTQEEWRYYHNEIGTGVAGKMADIAHCRGFYEGGRTVEEEKANAQHIATFDPPTVLRLLDTLDQMAAVLHECSSDYNHPYFTDRRGTGERITKALEAYKKLGERE